MPPQGTYVREDSAGIGVGQYVLKGTQRNSMGVMGTMRVKGREQRRKCSIPPVPGNPCQGSRDPGVIQEADKLLGTLEMKLG